MKRLAIFALLGPPLGLLIMVLMPPFTHGKPFEFPNPAGLLLVLPFAYFIGIGPALVAAIADWLLAKVLGLYPRVLATAGVGYLAAFAWMFATGYPEKVSLRLVFAFGIVGFIPAAVCSWLSAKRE